MNEVRRIRCGNDNSFYNAYRVAGNYLSLLAQLLGKREAPGSASGSLAQL
ncbi:MAG: hypothetical protein JST84_08985 [Acidobacteria bacterium]|nr:hypothetical protein [Acidobacteriota bacterium]